MRSYRAPHPISGRRRRRPSLKRRRRRRWRSAPRQAQTRSRGAAAVPIARALCRNNKLPTTTAKPPPKQPHEADHCLQGESIKRKRSRKHQFCAARQLFWRCSLERSLALTTVSGTRIACPQAHPHLSPRVARRRLHFSSTAARLPHTGHTGGWLGALAHVGCGVAAALAARVDAHR